MPIRYKSVHLPLWQWDGALLRGAWLDYLRWADTSMGVNLEMAEIPSGHAWVQPGRPWMIWTVDDDPAVFAHEAFHVTAGVLGNRGLMLSEDSEEAYAYTLMSLMFEGLSTKGWAKVGKSGRVG